MHSKIHLPSTHCSQVIALSIEILMACYINQESLIVMVTMNNPQI